MMKVSWNSRRVWRRLAVFSAILAFVISLGLYVVSTTTRLLGHGSCVVVVLNPQGSLDAQSGKGLLEVLEEAFDCAGDTPLYQAPPGWAQKPKPLPFLEVDLEPRRLGTSLGFGGRWRQVEQGRALGWRPFELPPLPPKEAILELGKILSVPLSRAKLDVAIPGEPALFWDSARINRMPVEEARHLFRSWEGKLEPGSLMEVRYASGLRSALWDLPLDGQRLWEEARAMSDRGLRRNPESPAAIKEWAHYAIHAGEGRTVLNRLIKALKENPHSPTLAYMTSYAARYAGRLDIAIAALDRMEALDPRGHAQRPNQTARLYFGDRTGYGESLAANPGVYWQAYAEVQRGRLALMNGDRETARAHFLGGRSALGSHQAGHQLAKGFLAAVEGRNTEAIRVFRELDRHRTDRGLFDGELALFLAEGAVLAGDPRAGQAYLERAYIDGFNCSEWLLRDPLLIPLQGTPRWKALLLRAKEREERVQSLAL